MNVSWVQDRTGLNVLHRVGCAHTHLSHDEPVTIEGADLDEILIAVAQDNADPDIETAHEAAEWVGIAPCLR